MKRQSGYSSFPAILLTFSVLLLVLAVGFVVGRVVVARAYLDRAPKFETQVSAVPEPEESQEPRASAPGRVYVPPPVPPPAPPEGENGEGASPEEAAEGSSVGLEAIRQAAEKRPERSPDLLEPQRESPRAEPRAESRPTPPPPPPAEEKEKVYAIQVGVFTSLQGARQVIDDLARSGYPARISPEKRGTQELYRVVTGRYRSEYAARKALDQLRKEGFEAFLVEE